MNFFVGCKSLFKTNVVGNVVPVEEIGALDKSSQRTLSCEACNLKVLAVFVDKALNAKSSLSPLIEIKPLAVNFKISLLAKNCPDLNAEKVAINPSIELFEV